MSSINLANAQAEVNMESASDRAERLDAGLKSLDHYQTRLPQWRYLPRQWLIPIVRWETPYLAALQRRIRTPALDSYFAFTANLGTHTFFMVFLPLLFWSGYTEFGRGMVHILAGGVFFSGWIKDLLCLPRPLSPPLQRITMSGSAAMEYGFPSTHSTNAVSVALYCLFFLETDHNLDPKLVIFAQILAYCYACSIIFGRIYCGMHGFADVIVGSLLGAFLTGVQWHSAAMIDSFVMSSGWAPPISIFLAITVLVRAHPEPADDCPCYDDSVAFAGVVIGINLGHWHYASLPYSLNIPSLATVPYSLTELGWTVTVLRVLLGVLLIFLWREAMKPTLLRWLPHLFRILSTLGLLSPRRFFMDVSDYKAVPKYLKTDSIIPSPSAVITSIRNPRKRAVSIGPQSAADAYETIHYRQKKRSESITSVTEAVGAPLQNAISAPEKGQTEQSVAQVLGLNGDLHKTTLSQSGTGNQDLVSEREEKEIFSQIQRPRVRYDVEVVTKLIIYSGIGIIAVEAAPLMFEFLGLGLGVHHETL